MKYLRTVTCIVLLLVFGAANSSAPLSSKSDVQLLYTKFDRMQNSWNHTNGIGVRAATAYNQMFAYLQTPAALRASSISDLHALYGAAYITTFYSYKERYLADMRRDYAELQVRNADTAAERKELFESFVRLREFSEARTFSAKHPHIEANPLPHIFGARDPSSKHPAALFVNQNENALTLRTVELDPHVEIVVVGHPLCHFTQYAGKALEADSKLRKVLREHSVWISPQDGNLDIADFQQWNREHPDLQMAIVWKQDEWPQIDYWGTPTFYFFRNGALVDKVTGWSKEGNRAALIAALHGVGLMH